MVGTARWDRCDWVHPTGVRRSFNGCTDPVRVVDGSGVHCGGSDHLCRRDVWVRRGREGKLGTPVRAGPQRPYRRPPPPDDGPLWQAIAAVALAVLGLILLWIWASG